MAKIECPLSCKQKLPGVLEGGSEPEFLCFPSACLRLNLAERRKEAGGRSLGHVEPVLRVRGSASLHSGTAWTSRFHGCGALMVA